MWLFNKESTVNCFSNSKYTSTASSTFALWMKYLPNFHPNKDKVQISYYLVLVSPASKQFWGELRKMIFFFFCYSESLLWSWQWKSQNVSKLSLVFTISWNNNVKCNTKSMVIKHQKFFSLLDVIIYVWCMEKKCFSKNLHHLQCFGIYWNYEHDECNLYFIMAILYYLFKIP